MVLEIATIDVRPGAEDSFLAAYQQVKAEVSTTPGCLAMELLQGVESPSRFVLLVQWENLDAHLQGFRATERFVRWRAGVTPYLAAPPAVEHFTDLADLPGLHGSTGGAARPD